MEKLILEEICQKLNWYEKIIVKLFSKLIVKIFNIARIEIVNKFL